MIADDVGVTKAALYSRQAGSADGPLGPARDAVDDFLDECLERETAPVTVLREYLALPAEHREVMVLMVRGQPS